MKRSILLSTMILTMAGSDIDAALPPVMVPLSLVAKTSDSIAVAAVISARVIGSSNRVEFGVSIENNIRGIASVTCVTGPSGLKVGRNYVLFLRKSHMGDGGARPLCNTMEVAGTLEPYAFEIETLPGGTKFVRLDNRRVVPPKFADAIELRQSLEVDNVVSELVIGTIVPLDTFVAFVEKNN